MQHFKQTLRRLYPTHFLHSMVIILAILGVSLLIIPSAWLSPTFFPRLAGIGCFIYIFLIASPRLIFTNKTHNRHATSEQKEHALTRIQTYLAIGLLLGMGGTLGLFRLHRLGFEYDKLIHFVFPFLLALGITRLLHTWLNIKLSAAITYAVLFVLSMNITWEFIELASDAIFGTSSWGQEGKEIVRDTSLDMLANLAGITLGSLWAYRKEKKTS